ncbi:ABC transporter permease [Paenibacillus baekrokdamisoli]|uniref:ABC transporter permease n=1 Tax=Paenibacillus baekrokdamisoli TaxID=1712516 RepID=A0A3G9JKB2_9BACL|nr:carbohydrate ABC transporter permease [Paenibacillus baekrokdamisoli]MBB3068657.1 putative aldouronate transport system permease protein [Paenibacillus baekrokdamisoli]BBH23489.1 ABC transporter permease [Paenibacillus baekrokdamisoli]
MRESRWRAGFHVFNYTFLCLISIACVLPMVHVLALSLSSNAAASAGIVRLWPIGFNTTSYSYVMEQAAFINSFVISLKRVAIGVSINILLTILLAYPLSKESHKFKSRTIYAWFFVFTMLFGGGLIPAYMVIRTTGLLDSIWALVLPGAVPVFSAILLLNFFRGLPKELEEAAFIDGAGHFTTLFRIFLPLSTPAIATIVLLSSVGHWNSWFDGLIYMNSPDHYPLQSYLQTIVIQKNFSGLTDLNSEMLRQISDRTVKAAQIFLGALPVLVVYPFLQKYFMKGIVMGSVKE